MKKLVLALCSMLAVAGAQASVIGLVEMNFQSGAEFKGHVTFSDDFASVESVDGVLKGYQMDSTDFLGSGSTAIQTLYAKGYNFATDPSVNSTVFIDNGNLIAGIYGGPYETPDYSNWITFNYNFSDVTNLSLLADSSVNNVDGLKNGYISVPEPSSLVLIGLGLLALVLPRASRKR